MAKRVTWEKGTTDNCDANMIIRKRKLARSRTKRILSLEEISERSRRHPYYKKRTRLEPDEWWNVEKYGDIYTESKSRRELAARMQLKLSQSL